MSVAGPLARACRLAAAAAFVCASAGSAAAQSTEPDLKAAFLFAFVKFVVWPADALAPGERLTMCVVGDDAVADALSQTVKGIRIEGHELTVAVLKTRDAGAGCHVIYVSSTEIKRSAALLLLARASPVLTVSDGDHFAESGGVSQLIVENHHIRFAINLASAKRGRLSLSSKLLSLATIVKDDRRPWPADARPSR